MGSERHKTFHADTSVEDLFDAVLYTVQEGKYASSGVSHEIKETIFVSDRTLLSWGTVFVVSVVPDGTGALLQLTADTVPGAPKALLDGGKNDRAAEAFIAQVTENLAKTPRPKPDPVESWQYAPDGSTIPWTTRDFPA